MARQARDWRRGGTYHVWSRAVAGRGVFLDDEDRLGFLERFHSDLRWGGGELIAWCLAGHRFEAVVRTGDVSLSRILHRTLTWHACRFNRRHARRGRLFGGRFGSRLLPREGDLARVVRAIHGVPVDAGRVSDPSRWPWSSWRGLHGGGGGEVVPAPAASTGMGIGEGAAAMAGAARGTGGAHGGGAPGARPCPGHVGIVAERAPSVLRPAVGEEVHGPALALIASRVAHRCGTVPSRLPVTARGAGPGDRSRAVFLLVAVDGAGIPLARAAAHLALPAVAAARLLGEARGRRTLLLDAARVLSEGRSIGVRVRTSECPG